VVLSSQFRNHVADPSTARALLGSFMAGESADGALRNAFHWGYIWVMITCALAAFGAGIIGGMTAPKRTQTAE
jgi:hypothetical protein